MNILLPDRDIRQPKSRLLRLAIGAVAGLCLLPASGSAEQQRHPFETMFFPTPEVERVVRHSALLHRAAPALGNSAWTKLACCLACLASDGPDPTDGLTCTWCWYSIPGAAVLGAETPTPYVPFEQMHERLLRVLPHSAQGYGFRVQAISDTEFEITNTGRYEDTGIVTALEYGIPMHPGLNLRDARIVEPKSQVLEDIEPGEARRVVVRPSTEGERSGFLVGVISSSAVDRDGNGMAAILTAPPSGLGEDSAE